MRLGEGKVYLPDQAARAAMHAELRRKIERDPARPAWLLTEPGVGYRLRSQLPGR